MSTISLTPQTVAAERTSVRSAWIGFAVVIAACLMDLLDSTIAQTAAPAIRRDLGGSFATLEWISAGYTLAMSVSLLLGSRLGDIVGRRRALLAGIVGFAGTSTLCAFAPDPETLIVARVLQGACAAVMVPQCFGLIRELFGAEGQAKALGIVGPVMGLGAVLGPLAGGGLIDLNLLGSGWRAIFLINVPIAMVAIAVGRRHLPAAAPTAPGARPDVLSVALAMVGGFGLVYPLIEGRAHGWPAWSFALLAAGALSFAGFVRRQHTTVHRGRTPLVDPAILHRRPYVAGLATVLCFIAAMGGMMIALNVMLQTGLGDSPLHSGLETAAIPVAAIAGSITSSLLLERLGRLTMLIGSSVMAVGLIVTVTVLHSTGASLAAWQLAGPLALTGYGMGMVFVPMFDIVLAGVPHSELGSASGLLESVQQFAMSVGIAVVGTVLFDHLGHRLDPAGFVSAAQHGLVVAAGFLVAAAISVLWLPRHAREGAGH
ncbi:MAG TPA: MFS transporter [Solirubrobacteraceae bacterium]|nr:MFS transporter [Solirubrobacteraceae bacterium]